MYFHDAFSYRNIEDTFFKTGTHDAPGWLWNDQGYCLIRVTDQGYWSG